MAGVRVRDVLPNGVDIEGVYRRFNDHGREYGIAFTVNEILPNTRKALEATEFARENNRFEVFRDSVFRRYFSEGQDIGRVPVLLEIAGDLGLDRDALKYALDKGVYTPVVEENRRLAQEMEVGVLPTFFIDDVRIAGIKDYAYFQKVLQSVYG